MRTQSSMLWSAFAWSTVASNSWMRCIAASLSFIPPWSMARSLIYCIFHDIHFITQRISRKTTGRLEAVGTCFPRLNRYSIKNRLLCISSWRNGWCKIDGNNRQAPGSWSRQIQHAAPLWIFIGIEICCSLEGSSGSGTSMCLPASYTFLDLYFFKPLQ